MLPEWGRRSRAKRSGFCLLASGLLREARLAAGLSPRQELFPIRPRRVRVLFFALYFRIQEFWRAAPI